MKDLILLEHLPIITAQRIEFVANNTSGGEDFKNEVERIRNEILSIFRVPRHLLFWKPGKSK